MEYIKDEIFDYNAQNYLDEKKILTHIQIASLIQV